MVRKILICVLCGLIFCGMAYAASLTSNASPVTITWGSANYKSVTFSTTTRNLVIQNNDSAAYVYIDLKNSDNTADKGKCVLIAPSGSLELYDFLTDGISVITEGGTYGSARKASPVVVIPTY